MITLLLVASVAAMISAVINFGHYKTHGRTMWSLDFLHIALMLVIGVCFYSIFWASA